MTTYSRLLLAAAVLVAPLLVHAQRGDPRTSEVWLPVPRVVTPGTNAAPASDAVVLFAGADLSDSYNNPTYSNGQAASIYKQHIPLVNASRKPGEWQTYDVVFRGPRFKDDGSLARAAYITVLHNGVLVQDHVEIQGSTVFVGSPA